MTRTIKLYWSTSLKEGRQNMGDWLSPVLCQRLSGARIVHAPSRHCEMMAVGSILQKANRRLFGPRIHVWGSGLLEEKRRFRTRHYLHAVRGCKTAEKITGASVTAVGDPGLLCGWLFPVPRRRKRYSVGLIPHYVDRRHPLVKHVADHARRATVIDILVRDAFRDLPALLEQISQCEVVFSSSLHGLILCDSLGVPNAWIRLSDQVLGNGFKYRDYYSVFGISDPKPFGLTATTTEAEVLELAADYRRPGIDEIRRGLLRSFPFPRSRAA